MAIFSERQSHNIQRNKEIWSVHRKKQTCLEQRTDGCFKINSFKQLCLNMFRELKEYMEKVKKYMFEQNRNISKEIKCLKGNQKTF